MEPKKNEAYDLERKSPLFFSIGLVVALLLVTAAFEWKGQYEPFDIPTPYDPFEDPDIIIEPTVFPTPKPPNPKPIVKPNPVSKKEVPIDQAVIKAVEDYVEPTDHKNIDIESDPIDFNIGLDTIPEEEAEVIFDPYALEKQPSFPGGYEAFNKFLNQHLKYPSKASRNDVQGQVFMRFVIDTDGSIIDVEVMKGIGFGCDEEAKRVLESSPKWNPGKQRGREVKVRMSVPVFFRLE